MARIAATLTARDICVEHKNFTLSVPEFTLVQGTTTALLGPSGSGKSTLLYVLGLLEKPARGQVLLNGEIPTTKQAREHIAAVFQRPYLIKGNVEKNVAYGLRIRGVAAAERKARVKTALAQVGLEGFEKRSIAGLSGGEAQRVALARALVLEPSVLLLDEPLSSLDEALKRKLSADFSRILHELSITALYVTHDYGEAHVVADSIAVMKAGTLVIQAPAKELGLLQGEKWVTDFLDVQSPFSGEVVAISDGFATLQCGSESIVAVDKGYRVGESVFVSISPEDVVVFLPNEEVARAKRNAVLSGEIACLEPKAGAHKMIVRTSAGEVGVTVSQAALDDLAVDVGDNVQVSIDARAVRVTRNLTKDDARD